jgi:hypothetical protein
MKTYQLWFVNEDVLIVQAEKADASENLARFFVGEEMVAAFSFEQVLGFCNMDSIIEAEEDGDEDL